MATHAEKTKSPPVINDGKQNQAGAQTPIKMKEGSTQSSGIQDNRLAALSLEKLNDMAAKSTQAIKLQAYQQMANNSPLTVQVAQLREKEKETALPQPVPDKTSASRLPATLKAGIENLSGFSMDDVQVHYNSAKPAELNALAYAQGSDIHLGRGQEKHLPHEAWHVVQQKQQRVKPTIQLKGKVDVNDDKGLETEADLMGMKAFQFSGAGHVPAQKIEKSISQQVVQRNGSSSKVLRSIAEPKVGEQDIELAKGIQDDLEEIYQKKMKIDDLHYVEKAYFNSAVCLGGIILPPLKGLKDVKDLIPLCKFVNLGKGSVNRGIYELLPGDLKERIVKNTLLTMDDANQLNYLKETEFAGEKESGWKIVIEVHYYRERPTTTNVFHKDTLGTTLFVNLNYLNTEKMVGPEYLVNPADNEKHLQNLAGSLPKEFLQDRETVMAELEEPKIIEVVEVPKYGYVAFVDETIHHSSPTTAHRKVKGSQIHQFLKNRDEKHYNTYKAAYDKWKKQRIGFWDYESYLPEGGGFDGPDWLGVFENIEDGEKRYDRNEIREIEPERRVLSDTDIDHLVHIGAHDSFGKVSIPKAGRTTMTKDDRPLKRRMSMNLGKGTGSLLKKESGGKRSFFRTWVRAEKADTEVIKPDWKWDQKL